MTLNEISQKIREAINQVQINSNIEEIIQELEKLSNYSVLAEYSVQDLKEFILGLLKLGTITEIRAEGCLVSELENIYLKNTKFVNLLSFLKILNINQWYKFDVIKLTSLGERITDVIIKAKTQDISWDNIFFRENFFSLLLTNRLLPHGGAFAKHYTESFRYSGTFFPVTLPSKVSSETFFNLMKDNKIWQERLKILLDKFKEDSLVFEATRFVSTDRGKLSGPYYCISTVLAQEINRVINTTYKECNKLLNKKLTDFESKYFGLQFFDRLLFHHHGWELGQINSVGALELFNDYYIKYYDSIMEYITIFKDNFLIDETVKTKIPSIHIKSPQSFLTSYKEQYSKIMDIMDEIPLTECKALNTKVDSKQKPKTPAQPKDVVAPVSITTVIGRRSDVGQKGYLGTIEHKKLFLDLYHPHVITILGVQGSGKSYTAGVILEMALKSIENISDLRKPLSGVIFHFSREESRVPEWIGLNFPNDDIEQIEKLKMHGLKPTSINFENMNIWVTPSNTILKNRIKEYQNLQVSKLLFDPSLLSGDDWNRILGFGKEARSIYKAEINYILTELRDKHGDQVDVELLKHAIESSDMDNKQKKLANIRIKQIEHWLSKDASLFHTTLKSGIMNLVDLRDRLMDRQLAAKILQILFSIVKERESKEICMIAIDEAHLFFKQRELSEDIIEFVRLMRKQYRVYLLLISQSPKDFDGDILGLSDIVICHRIEDSTQINMLTKHKPQFRDVSLEIGKLRPSIGEAFIWSREATDASFIVKPQKVIIRPKVTADYGKTATAY